MYSQCWRLQPHNRNRMTKFADDTRLIVPACNANSSCESESGCGSDGICTYYEVVNLEFGYSVEVIQTSVDTSNFARKIQVLFNLKVP